MSPQALKSRKGEQTRAQILDAAVRQASEAGFESLTIGSLADRTGLSKSGLFAHFGSRLDLQLAVLDEAARRFTEAVLLPAAKAPRGLRRLRVLFENWLAWTEHAGLDGGCPIQAAATEYDSQPGPLRDAVAAHQRALGREVLQAVKLAVETGELSSGTDPRQFVFELYGLVLACYQSRKLQGEGANGRALTGFDRLVESYRASAATASARRVNSPT